MSKRTESLLTLDHHPVGSNRGRAEKKRQALQQILDSIPLQIDAIKEKRLLAAI
jgi:hypothetical protein